MIALKKVYFLGPSQKHPGSQNMQNYSQRTKIVRFCEHFWQRIQKLKKASIANGGTSFKSKLLALSTMDLSPNWRNLSFPGRGQRDTPVADVRGQIGLLTKPTLKLFYHFQSIYPDTSKIFSIFMHEIRIHEKAEYPDTSNYFWSKTAKRYPEVQFDRYKWRKCGATHEPWGPSIWILRKSHW